MPHTNGHGPKRAILYARVSTDEQAKRGYSLAQQLEALREYAVREGYEILEEVVDAVARARRAWRDRAWTM
jgi:site-specific DNA recombinase